MKRAFSYIRFSTPEQAKGGSLKRQLEASATYAEKHGYILDSSSYRDLGISAAKGKNATIGKLGEFIAAVENGVIPSGSLLIVENLDRISRQEELSEALELFLKILRLGVELVTLTPENHFKHKGLNTTQLIIAIIELSRAASESTAKSLRHKSNWQQFYQQFATNAPGKKGTLSKICPKWLTPSGKEYIQVPEKVATVRKIYSLYLDGFGTHAIADTLNSDSHATLGHGKRWSSAQVMHVLRHPGVIGCRTINGELIECLPAIINRKLYDTVQSQLTKRSDSKQRKSRQTKVNNNLFTGLVCSTRNCEFVDWTLHTSQWGKSLRGPKPEKGYYHIPYDAFEKIFMGALLKLDLAVILGEKSAAVELDDLKSQLESIASRLEAIEAKIIEGAALETLTRAAQKLETRKGQIEQQINKLTEENPLQITERVGLLKRLVPVLNESESIRRKVKAQLRMLIRKIILAAYEEKSPYDRMFVFDVVFFSGAVRRMCCFFKRKPDGKGVIADVITNS